MRSQILGSISLVLGAAVAGCSSNGSVPGVSLNGAAERTSNNAVPAADLRGKSRLVNWSEFGFIPSGGRFNAQERVLGPSNVHRLHDRWSVLTGCSGSVCGGSSPVVDNGSRIRRILRR